MPNEYEFLGCLGTLIAVLVIGGLVVIALIGFHDLARWLWTL